MAAVRPPAWARSAALAIEQRDIDRDAAGERRQRHFPRRRRDARRQRRGEGRRRGLERLVRAARLRWPPRRYRRGAPSSASMRASAATSTRLRSECRSRWPCASFANLPKPPARVRRGTGCRRRYLSVPPTKSPMSIKRCLGQPMELLDRALGSRAGRSREMAEARSRAPRRCRDGSRRSRRRRNRE